jgi:hypothetical protein
MQIQWAPSPNFKVGRKGRKIIAIVNHITAGLMPGTLSWLRNPTAKVSAHYLVTKSGQIYQLVKQTDTAYHAGIVNKPNWSLYDGTNPNLYTLGIEHEALAGESLTEQQYLATLGLHNELLEKWEITVDHEHIIGHYRLDTINRKNDPGPGFPWDRLFQDLTASTKQQSLPTVPIYVEDMVFQGFIINNTTYAPVRALLESLGHQVEWKSGLNAVLIPPVTIKIPSCKDNTLRIVTRNIIILGIFIKDRAYAPVRHLCEALGYKVTWDNEKRLVMID